MVKIINDKYYTPKDLAKRLIDTTIKVLVYNGVNDIEDIIVPSDFQKSHPSPKKIIEYTKRYEQLGIIDTAITVKKKIVFGVEKYILTNGYIRLLILKQNGISEIPVKFEK